MAKGSSYEREICKLLSLWWTQDMENPREDVFWRTGGSGGRATIRGKKGKGTYNQVGDICAVDPIGAPLTDYLSIEIKRGYSRYTIVDLLDRSPKRASIQVYQKWLEQVTASASLSKTFSWILITRRDQRQPLLFCPKKLARKLPRVYRAVFHLQDIQLFCYLLNDWLQAVTPELIRTLSEAYRELTER